MIPDAERLLLLLALLWPMVMMTGLIQARWRTGLVRLTPLAALPALLLSIQTPSSLEFNIDWLLLGVSLGIDEISSVFLLFTSILWIAGSLLARNTTGVAFNAAFLLTMAGSFTALLARDVPTFFMGYALMSLATFGLIFDASSSLARRAGRIYLVFVMLGEMVLLTALIMVAQNAGTLEIEHVADRRPDDLLIALLLIGFGIKSGVPLLHLALPPVYAALPAMAAVPVAGGLLHMGLYGWLRFLPLEYPQEMTGWSQTFLLCGFVAILYGSIVGLLQKNPRSLLAYSSISQMGLMTILVAMLLAQPDYRDIITASILLFALHHALAKGALFHGLAVHGRSHWSLWIPGLSLAGAPLTSGALAKWQVKSQIVTFSGEWAVVGPWLLAFGSIGTTLLIARFFYLTRHPDRDDSLPLYRWWADIGWWLLVLAVVLLPWLWPLSTPRVMILWSALWPVLLGASIAFIAYKNHHRLPALPVVPPGDLLIPIERLVTRLLPKDKHHTHHAEELNAIMHPNSRHEGLFANMELFISRWPLAMALVSLGIFALYLLM